MDRKFDIQEADLVVFAGQSNMSGRGDVAEAVVCDRMAGYEYKAVSRPDALFPIREPFGLGEDREGAIWDYDENHRSKRTGSMVSAAAGTYHALSGRRIVGVSASIGGSDTVQWRSIYLPDAVDRLERAKAFLAEHKIRVENTFIVWCQGESDGDAKRTAEAYIANTKAIFDVFRAHGAQKCFLVQTGHYNYVRYPKVVDGLTGEEWDLHYGIIRDAQEMLCKTDESFILAGSFEPYLDEMRDRFHYKQSAYNQVGKEVGTSLAGYVAVHT